MAKKYIIASIVLFSLSFVGVLYLIYTAKKSTTINYVCTTDAKQCPDGSYVGRSMPNCQFAECPSSLTPTVTPEETPSQSDNKTISALNFSISYPSSYQLHQDKESGGIDRYTLVGLEGDITVHIGPNWSWEYPNRVFDGPAIAGYSTFTYEVANQIITDLVTINDDKVTLQCVHEGSEKVKADCQQIFASFQALPITK